MRTLAKKLSDQIGETMDEAIIESMDFGLWAENIAKDHPEYAGCEVWLSELTMEMVVRLPGWPNGRTVETINDNLSRSLDNILQSFPRGTKQ